MARVKATFMRRKSFKKPIVCRLAPERTQDRMIMSFSWPWKPSTVLKLRVSDILLDYSLDAVVHFVVKSRPKLALELEHLLLVHGDHADAHCQLNLSAVVCLEILD